MGKDLLGSFEQMCLLALIRLEANAYGRTIQEELEQRADRSVALGQVYVALERLEEKGMVTSRFGEATATRGGKRKRYFRITALGEEGLRQSLDALDRLRFGTHHQPVGEPV